MHAEYVVVFPFVQMIVDDWLDNLLVAHRVRQIWSRNRVDRSEFIVAGEAHFLLVLHSQIEMLLN